MFQNYDIDISELLKITGGGLQVASFVQIRDALVNKYKSVYGIDIDLSTGSADGIFINDLALIINNICQTVQFIYSNLDVNTANGVYLDALCALSNITRKDATYSNASLTITNKSNSNLTLNEGTVFVDTNGTEWLLENSVTIASAGTESVQVICSVPGRIEALAGSINNTILNLPITISQPADANVGSDIESDSDLRARRSQSNGASGITVQESLIGALLDVAGIDDVHIYNNNTDSPDTKADGTSVDANSLYIIIRKQSGVTLSDENIGTIIHNKLTPGIHTCETDISGDSKSYQFVEKVYDKSITESAQMVYWKEATPIHPTIEITFLTESWFTADEFTNTITPKLIEYLNNLPLCQDLDSNQLLSEALNADPKWKGIRTYSIGTVTISSATNTDTYYNYTTGTPTAITGGYKLTLS